MSSALLLPLCWDASGEHGCEIQQHVLLLCTVTATAQEIKKSACLRSVSRIKPRAGLPRVSGGVYSQVVFLCCLCRNLWAPASGRQLPSGPRVDENYKQENWAASTLSTSFPAVHPYFPQACRLIPGSCCSKTAQRNVAPILDLWASVEILHLKRWLWAFLQHSNVNAKCNPQHPTWTNSNLIHYSSITSSVFVTGAVK